jgi:hypothetical protein
MPDIGIALGSDRLVLTRRRDFKWFFDNLDEDDTPIDFPAGRLFFELDTGGAHNSEQIVRIFRAKGGTYDLTVNVDPVPGVTEGVGGITPDIGYSSESGPFKTALESVVGAGNTEVSMLYYPQWVIQLTTQGSLDPKIDVNAIDDINQVFYTVFNGLTNIVGIFRFELVYEPPVLTYTVTQVNGLDESDILGYIVNSVSGAISSGLDNLSWVNNVTTDFQIEESYAPVREFRIEFINDLAEVVVDELVLDTSNVTNPDVTPYGEVQYTATGKPRFDYWEFDIVGPQASIKVESELCNQIAHRTRYQLVFLPDGEDAGGWAVARGRVGVLQ